jgi:LPXTG-motif cell wall-anchored protein
MGLMGGADDNMTLGILGILLILAALIVLVFIRRGRKKVKYS